MTANTDSVVDRIGDSASTRIPFSVEFFPARTESALDQLWEVIKTYEKWGAAFASVTYGAGGSNREKMVSVTQRIAQETTLLPLAHLTAVNHSRSEIMNILDAFRKADIHNILALRGDPPGDPLGIWRKHPEGVEFASELVEMIHDAGGFHTGVAAFPGGHFRAPSLDADTHYTLRKYRKGAEFSLTQIFFSTESYLRLRDRLINADRELGSRPLIPSIMPISSLASARRMVALSGSRLPRNVERQLDVAAGYGPKENVRAVADLGVDLALTMCEELMSEGVPSLHFDTLNKLGLVAKVMNGLGLISDAQWQEAQEH